MTSTLNEKALAYHLNPTPGKIAVVPTKQLNNQEDLSLAYSPGVAAACEAIANDVNNIRLYTSRANLVAVISNGTAVLGLGNIGPYAAKPVMEGKACLFQKFAGINVFDIELDETDPDKLVDAIAMMEPTFGGINLEDFKAPECFYIERKLKERMSIPVFHDDQHGTAIVASAGIINGLKLAEKSLDQVRLVCSGAGAAAIACLDLLVRLGLKRENILLVDSKGVVFEGRDEQLEFNKSRYATKSTARTLADAVKDADIFLGCSAAKLLKPEMVETMALRPLILALANPEPEIQPELAKSVRSDVLIATGRSDFPNQVNNVLCFPFLFRGALDVEATTVNDEMKMAAVHALASLAQKPVLPSVQKAYPKFTLEFGPDYFIPTPFDPRLISEVASAVAQAAMDSGVARRPLDDTAAYAERLLKQFSH